MLYLMKYSHQQRLTHELDEAKTQRELLHNENTELAKQQTDKHSDAEWKNAEARIKVDYLLPTLLECKICYVNDVICKQCIFFFWYMAKIENNLSFFLLFFVNAELYRVVLMPC